MSIFDAVLRFSGNKRKIIKQIFSCIDEVYPQREWVGKSFGDAFIGGGSVSLAAKFYGFGVRSNDLAWRSYVVGKALIECPRALTREDMVILCRDRQDPGSSSHIADTYDTTFTPDLADFLDDIYSHVRDLGEDHPLYWMGMFLLIKLLLYTSPFGRVGHAPECFWGPLIDGYDLDKLKPLYHSDARKVLRPDIDSALSVMKQINRGVVESPISCQAFNMDVRDFIDANKDLDVLYLDPPYPGTNGYEFWYDRLDDCMQAPVDSSVEELSKDGAIDLVQGLIERSEGIEVVALSYGNAVYSLEDLEEVFKKTGRRVVSRRVQYRHYAHKMKSKKAKKNYEYIVVGIGE